MEEILLEKSEAVGALNKVPGFNPLDFARHIKKDNQEEQLYLDVKFRKLWFRLAYPNGKIIKRIVNFSENMAVIESRVYLDRNDREEDYVSNAYSQKFRTQDPEFGDKFLESAETAATGRALSDAGFGIQLADIGEENDQAQADAGIPLTDGNTTGNFEHSNSIQHQTGFQEQPGNAMLQMPDANAGMMNTLYQQAQVGGNVVGQAIAPTPPNTWSSNAAVATPAETASLTLEDIVKGMSYEEATMVRIGGNGKFGNQTMGQVAMESPSSLQWFAESYTGHDKRVPAAARVILNRAIPKAG